MRQSRALFMLYLTNHSGSQRSGWASSLSFESQSPAFTTPLATSTPSAPSSSDFSTSSPLTIPAPQRTFPLYPALLTSDTVSLINPGLALDTAIPEPISCGGSMARYFVPSEVSLTASFVVLAQRHASIPAASSFGTSFLSSAMGMVDSLWLRMVPDAPAALTDSTSIAPVVLSPDSALKVWL